MQLVLDKFLDTYLVHGWRCSSRLNHLLLREIRRVAAADIPNEEGVVVAYPWEAREDGGDSPRNLLKPNHNSLCKFFHTS